MCQKVSLKNIRMLKPIHFVFSRDFLVTSELNRPAVIRSHQNSRLQAWRYDC